MITCRDCKDGRHRHCYGDAWDDVYDEAAVCDCWKADHEERSVLPGGGGT